MGLGCWESRGGIVGEVSGVEIKRREEDDEKTEGSKKYCFVCRKKNQFDPG